MNAFFSYWTYRGGGGHELLSIIPYFLGLHENDFGDIAEMDVEVKFRSDGRPKVGDQELFDQFNDSLPMEPSFKIINSVPKLKIEYVSDYLPFDDGRSIGRYVLDENSTRGCRRLEKFVREFKEVLARLGPRIEKECDFDWRELVDLIDRKLNRLPTKDAEIISLIADERSSLTRRLCNSFRREPFHSDGVPDLIPVKRHLHEHSGTKYIGQYAKGNQFWGRVVADFRAPSSDADASDDWESRKRWYAILHKFDSNGNHLGTDYKFTGTTADGEVDVWDLAKSHMDNFISSLGPVRYGDISIKLFKVEIDGTAFGMIDTSTEEWGDAVTMEPGDLVFNPPWDGQYDT